MPHILKQQFNLINPSFRSAVPGLILSLGLEEYLAALYRSEMFLPEFYIKHHAGIEAAEERILQEQPSVLLVDMDMYFKSPESQILRRIRQQFPRLPILTLGINSDAEQVKQLMSLGVASHINRKFSRPQDVAAIAKTILNY